MNNLAVVTKIKNRLNKLDSGDYDNIPPFQLAEAVNKGQFNLVRRSLHGKNQEREGDEQSTRRIDDFELLLTAFPLQIASDDRFAIAPLPQNYLEWKRVDVKAVTEACDKGKNMIVYLSEEENVEITLRDDLRKPSFKWGETFCTLRGGNLRIYTNNEFDISSATLIYYRQPRIFELAGATNLYSGTVSTADVELEFRDDVCELIIDEAVKILAGDIESFNQYQRASESVESNT
jgi:hypothetical protein